MKQLQVRQIRDHVYYSLPDETTDRPVLGAIVGTKATLMVDAGNSKDHVNLFLSELAKLGIAQPNYVVLTHWHWDHVFGGVASAAPMVAHEETAQVLAVMAQQDWSDNALDQRVATGSEIAFCRDMIKAELPDRADLVIRIPDISFASQMVFNLGGVHCQVKHVGGDHAADATVIYVPEDKLIFLGDCLYVDLYHGPRNYTIQKLFPLLDEIASYDADTFIWSHSDEAMNRREMTEFMEQLRTIGEFVVRSGDDRDRILRDLPVHLGKPLEEESLELVDAFLAGLRKN